MNKNKITEFNPCDSNTSVGLVELIIDESSPEVRARLQRRVEERKVEILFNEELQSREISEQSQVNDCIDAIYEQILGDTLTRIREQRGVPLAANVKDYCSFVERSAISFAQCLAIQSMKRVDAQGFVQCRDISSDAAKKVRQAMD